MEILLLLRALEVRAVAPGGAACARPQEFRDAAAAVGGGEGGCVHASVGAEGDSGGPVEAARAAEGAAGAPQDAVAARCHAEDGAGVEQLAGRLGVAVCSRELRRQDRRWTILLVCVRRWKKCFHEHFTQAAGTRWVQFDVRVRSWR